MKREVLVGGDISPPQEKGILMDQDTPDTPNAALVALIAIAHYILVENALDDDFGRGQVKEIFRQALASTPSVQDRPEWRIAMCAIEDANAVEAAERSSQEGR